MGENYSSFIKTTHKLNAYEEADEYGVICYLASLTKNNYDPDFYIFTPYKEENFEVLEINLIKNKNIKEKKETVTYTEDKNIWEFPKNNMNLFLSWLVQLKAGVIDTFLNLKGFMNFGKMYANNYKVKEIKKNYNEMHKNKKYTIKMFYTFLKSIVNIEMRDKNGNLIKRVGSKTDYREISIKIIGKKFKTSTEIKEDLDVQTNLTQKPTMTSKTRLFNLLSYRVISSLNFFKSFRFQEIGNELRNNNLGVLKTIGEFNLNFLKQS